MSTNTLSRASLFAVSSGFGMSPTVYKKDNGHVVVERAAVFRSGTFRDSIGVQATYEKLHIEQLINNYKYLRDNHIFEDIPVRDGHPSWLVRGLPGTGQVVGWHDNVWTEDLASPVDAETYSYVLADLRMTDPAAAEKVLNGTFRHRSAEIMSYRTNSEAEFWPVYGGVAWVDIPAVEGLKFQSSNGNAAGNDRKLYVFMEKETGVGAEQNTTTAPPAPAQPLLGVTPPAQVYSINGTQVSDPAAVQAHITSLEVFRSESVETGRKNFINSLAVGNKILASQVESLTAFAVSLNPEQFEAWSKTFETAPVQPALGNHAAGVTNLNNAAQSGTDPKVLALDTAREVVKNHRRAGTPADQIKETKSYKTLVAAGETPEL